ncbi:MAG: tyrosine-type recombinase/integrase, partial [Clostridia bacterium]
DAFYRLITLSDFYSFLTYLSRERKAAPRTRARKAATVKSFFKYLHTKAKILETNPAQELDSPKITRTLPRYLNKNESIKLLSSVEGEHRARDLAMLVLFLNCGFRVTELVGIDMNRIDWDNQTLQVLGKGNKERVVYLNKACILAIRAYMETRPADGVIDKNALFLSERKTRISRKTVHTLVKKHLARAGLDSDRYSSHKLRHTAATLMYLHGNVDIKTLQTILGHESISTTEIYTHIDRQQLREAADNNPLADFLDSKTKS